MIKTDEIETLSIPPEPVEVKAQIREAIDHLKSDRGINFDVLVLWYRNSIPSYLWKKCGWGIVLKRKGFSWQKFLSQMKYRTEDTLSWIRGNITWKEFIMKILESLE